MKEKLAQCLKMLKFLGKDHIRFKYDTGKWGFMPFKGEHERHYKTFTLHNNGKVEYVGSDEFFTYEPKAKKTIHLTDLEPTESVLLLAYNKLRAACREQAKEAVMKRLVDHQLKYNELEFLIDN